MLCACSIKYRQAEIAKALGGLTPLRGHSNFPNDQFIPSPYV